MSKPHRWNSLEHGEPRPWAPDLIFRVIARYAAWVLAAVALAVSPVGAQEMERFDPDEAYGSAPAGQVDPAGSGEAESDVVYGSTVVDEGRTATIPAPGDLSRDTTANGVQGESDALPPDANAGTYGEDDLIGAAEGVFGKGAQGLAKLIEDLLRKQGEPNAYIVGREAGGAFVFGARYGSGTLHHKIEGERKVYWTGPSVGFDAGANAANTFVLVYNLFDTQDIFKRYPAGEGQAYFVGGLHASYMRRGDVVLIPIRMGAGLRLGVNAGYMRFSEKQRWVPF
ncbi:MAG: DUF1134 domain-containing protein [Erythrobacter sp.]